MLLNTAEALDRASGKNAVADADAGTPAEHSSASGTPVQLQAGVGREAEGVEGSADAVDLARLERHLVGQQQAVSRRQEHIVEALRSLEAAVAAAGRQQQGHVP